MKKIIMTAVAVAAVATPLAVTAAPAQAANAACMSNTEFGRIHNGMSRARVYGIVGSRGKVTFSWQDAEYPSLNEIDREWHRCGLPSYYTAEVDFKGSSLVVRAKMRF